VLFVLHLTGFQNLSGVKGVKDEETKEVYKSKGGLLVAFFVCLFRGVFIVDKSFVASCEIMRQKA